MNKRRAARELALITFSQLEKNLKKTKDINFSEIIQRSAKILTNEAENNLNEATEKLVEIREFVQDYEIEHPENLERPYDTAAVPVNVPLTSDMLGRMNQVLESVDKTYSAIDITKLGFLSGLEDVKDFAVKIVKTFIENSEQVDSQINENSRGWDVKRLVKIDRDILRIAVTEILFFEDVPISVSIDEAVELAKKYSEAESSGFINGILAQVAKAKKLSQE